MPFWRIVPPPPRPWAQSVAPAALVGRRIAANPPRPAGAAARTHTHAPSPQGVGSQPKWQHSTNALLLIAPPPPPPCSGCPRQEQWRTMPPSPLPARPPPLTRWISIGLHITNAPPIIAPCNSPSAPPILGAVGSPCGVARAGPTAKPPALATPQGLPPAPIPCALPPRGRAPYRLGAYNKCPIAYSPATAPALLGMPKAGAMADGAAIAPASPPPTPLGVDFLRDANNKCPAVCCPLQAPALLGSTKAGAMADGAAIAPASPPPTPHEVDFFSYINEFLRVVGAAAITGCIIN